MIRSAEEFVRLRSSEDPDEYGRAASDSAPLHVWREVARTYPQFRFWIAQNKAVPLEMLDALARDPDVSVRSMVARKRKLPLHLQHALAADDDAGVRAALAQNPKVVPEVLAVLLADPEPLVAEAARTRRDGG